MKRLLFYLLLTCCHAPHSLQASALDSLFQELKKHPQTDRTQINLLTRIALEYSASNKLLAIKYYKKAIESGQSILEEKELAPLYLDVAKVYLFTSQTEEGIRYNLMADKIFMQTKDTDNHFRVLNNLFAFYLNSANLKKAEEYLLKSENVLPAVRKHTLLAAHYSLKASLHLMQNRPDSVVALYYKSLHHSILANDMEGTTGTYSNLGAYYNAMGQYDSSEINIRKALALSHKDENTNFIKASAYGFLADMFIQQKQFNKAKSMLDSSNYFAELSHAEVILCDNLSSFSDLYAQQGNFKLQAYYLEKLYKTKDSLFGINQQNEWNQLEQNFMQELNEKALTEQKTKQRFYLILSLSFLLISITLLFLGYKIFRKNNLLNLQKAEIELQRNEILIQKEALQTLNQTKDKLFSIISHDLRNPLVTLSNFLDNTLEDTAQSGEPLKRKQETINSLHQSIHLLDTLLTWSYAQLNSQPPRIQPIELADWLEEIRLLVSNQAYQKQITVQPSLHDETDLILGDENMLSVVVRNLLTNAIKFSHPEGKIQVTTSRIHQIILMKIIDQGIGISEERLQEIRLHKFSHTTGTQKEKGSGLGLTIVADLLQKMKIDWSIESDEGKGTTITLELPAA